jgi:hypothetical protein
MKICKKKKYTQGNRLSVVKTYLHIFHAIEFSNMQLCVWLSENLYLNIVLVTYSTESSNYASLSIPC